MPFFSPFFDVVPSATPPPPPPPLTISIYPPYLLLIILSVQRHTHTHTNNSKWHTLLQQQKQINNTRDHCQATGGRTTNEKTFRNHTGELLALFASRSLKTLLVFVGVCTVSGFMVSFLYDVRHEPSALPNSTPSRLKVPSSHGEISLT